MELGIYTFAELAPDPKTGLSISHQQRMANLMEEAKLADEVGLDVFGLGEHHREDFICSAPAVALAAIAAITKNIRLTSAVTVLSSDDPVRVFEEFSTLDLLSGGRAEIMAGRGSFIESFPLFGYDLADYDALFSEKLELLLKLRDDEHTKWSGEFRAPLMGQGIYPRPVQKPLPVWIAVGGTPESVFRAGELGLPLAIAIIGGYPKRFAPLVELYHEAAKVSGVDESKLRVSINSHGFIGDDAQTIADEYFPHYELAFGKIGKERGWPPPSRDDFDAMIDKEGSMLLGNPEQVAEKILYEHELFGNDRFLLQLTVGTMPHERVLRAIELFGTEVAPMVHKELG